MFVRQPQVRKKRSFYYAVFYDPDSQRQIWQALGTKSKRSAEKAVRAMYREVLDGRRNPFAKEQIREEESVAAVNLLEAVDRYLDDRRSVCTPKTMKDFTSFFDLIKRELGDPSLVALSMKEVNDFIHREGLSSATKCSYFGRMRALLRWCAKHELIDDKRLKGLKPPKKERQ